MSLKSLICRAKLKLRPVAASISSRAHFKYADEAKPWHSGFQSCLRFGSFRASWRRTSIFIKTVPHFFTTTWQTHLCRKMSRCHETAEERRFRILSAQFQR